MMKDLYAILGVPPSASQTEIKKTFRKLAIQYHPDKNPLTETKDLFQEINEAYDILGDPEKRALYDTRRSHPVGEIVYEKETPKHRDPAYRRKNPPPQSYKREPPAAYILMRDNLKYLMWVSQVGLLSSTLFFIDYFLPYQHVKEGIKEIYAVNMRRGVAYHIVVTDTGRKIKLYDYKAGYFRDESIIESTSTMVYGVVISVSNASETYVVRLAYMYHNLFFFPVLLFINSLLAVVFRKRVELCFNLNVTCFIILIINYVLI